MFHFTRLLLVTLLTSLSTVDDDTRASREAAQVLPSGFNADCEMAQEVVDSLGPSV